MSIDTVIDELQDQSQAVAATSLAQLNGIASEDLTRFATAFGGLSTQRRRDVIDMLAELAEDNVELAFSPVFLLGLDDPDVQVRAQSIKALWEHEAPELARKLVLLLDDPEALVRGEAALALGLFLTRAELAGQDEALAEQIEEALRSLVLRREPDRRGPRARARGAGCTEQGLGPRTHRGCVQRR